MRLQRALYEFYHKYKDTDILIDTFKLICYISDYCCVDFQSNEELEIYIKVVRQINLVRILKENGEEEGLKIIKGAFPLISNVTFSEYKLCTFYTVKMFYDTYIESEYKSSKKVVKKEKTVKETKQLVEIADKPQTPTPTKTKKAPAKPRKPRHVAKPCLIYYTPYTSDSYYHYDLNCKVMRKSYSLIEYFNEKDYKKIKNKNKLCPYCSNYKPHTSQIIESGLTLKGALKKIAKLPMFEGTGFKYDIDIIVDKLRFAGELTNIEYNGLKICYMNEFLSKDVFIEF